MKFQSLTFGIARCYLDNAAASCDENIENVRNAFPKTFLDAMKSYIKTLVEDVEFDVKGNVPSGHNRKSQ